MPSSSSSKPGRTRTSSSIASRSSTTIAPTKTEISINVYDLLPPGRLSTLLWTLGTSLLHSGVVIASHAREYAYGGHNRRAVTGVYYTKPSLPPPGATHRCTLLHGFTYLGAAEISAVVKDVSETFMGREYNLLTYNCNHFTSALCERLTGKPAPGWLNRAAGIGVALPCVVPREWVNAPDVETAEGETFDDEDEEAWAEDERAGMLESDRRRRREEDKGQVWDTGGEEPEVGSSLAGGRRITSTDDSPPPRLVSLKDADGRDLPVAERAPIPKITKT